MKSTVATRTRDTHTRTRTTHTHDTHTLRFNFSWHYQNSKDEEVFFNYYPGDTWKMLELFWRPVGRLLTF